MRHLNPFPHETPERPKSFLRAEARSKTPPVKYPRKHGKSGGRRRAALGGEGGKETGVLAQSPDIAVYTLDLLPPPQADFHERMGGLPTELTPRTFHAARGTLVIDAHEDGRTDLVFDFEGLLPYGVYTLWDVLEPDFDRFEDRPLMDVPTSVDPNTPKWWNSMPLDPDGGPDGFGKFGFMADQNGRAHVTVNLGHRPGKEFLLDYHADGHVRGGEKGKTVFPGVLWARFPDSWD